MDVPFLSLVLVFFALSFAAIPLLDRLRQERRP